MSADQKIPFQYKSIKTRCEGIYTDRGSKFLAYAIPVKSINECKLQLEIVSGLHPKARHLCYAYRLGIEGTPFRFNDDGEPSGTAGRPIYNELLSNQMSDVLCAVVRYFGGTKLGVPGLIKAYRQATSDALSKAEIDIVSLTRQVHVNYSIEDMGRIYGILKNLGIREIESHYEPIPKFIFEVSLNKIPTIRQSILAEYLGYKLEDISDDFTSDKIEIMID